MTLVTPRHLPIPLMRRIVQLAVLAAGPLLAAPVLVPGAHAQAPGEILARTELRVCADPNDLPFSNEKGEGYENKTAELIGRELNLPVRFVYFPQIIGFVRNTLRARTCDLIMGTVAGDDVVQTTTPYYYSDYVVVSPDAKDFAFAGFDDPRLRTMRIGIISATPPSDLLVRHELMANAKPYALMVDTRYESATHEMVEDLVKGEIDLGLLWGPIAGYYIKREALKLKLTPIPNEPGAPRMDYHIAMGVRANEPDWRRQINAVIQKRQADITAILRDYGVPLLDEQGRLTGQP
jgi:quinoprotein dehydrogenase-associated probable ABC transporter substrate-binding protein